VELKSCKKIIAQELAGQIVQSLPASDATSGGRATGLMESGCDWD
jgi:uncharacterized membrane protein